MMWSWKCAHRGSEDIMGAASQQEGFAHFWVAVLRPRWLPCKSTQIIAKFILCKWIDFNKVQPLKLVLHRIIMRKQRTWYYFTTKKYLTLCDSDLIFHTCLFVCFSLEKTADKQKFYIKPCTIGTILTHPGRFSEDLRTSPRFAFQTQKPSFWIWYVALKATLSFTNLWCLILRLKVFFRLLCLGELGPLYPGTKAPELHTNYGGVRTLLLQLAAILNHPRAQKDWDPKNTYQGLFAYSLSFRTIYVPIWRLYDSAFFIDSQE